MSCDDFTITPGGRAGIGVVQPQSGLDYPLVAPSADIRYLIADFYLAYDDPGFYRANAAIRQHPLRIKWLYGVGCEPAAKPSWAPTPVHAADILIVDANNITVFNSTQLVSANGTPSYYEFTQQSWGDDYEIYEWIGSDAVCRLVVYKTWPPSAIAEADAADFSVDELIKKNWPTHLAPTSAILDERAVYKLPRRVRSIRVAPSAAPAAIRRSGVVLTAGHNMIIANGPPSLNGVRRDTAITFSAEPGAGTGKYEDCPEDPTSPIYQINGVTPDENGTLLMGGADCIYVRQPTALEGDGVRPVRTSGAATMALNTDCPPCCDCPDYVAVAEYMNRVGARYVRIGQRTHETKLLHESNIDRWAEERDCRLSRPLRAFLTPQNCPLLDVVAMYCNQCQECAENVELTITFSSFPAVGSAELVCGYTFLYAPGYPGVEFALQGAYPTYTVRLPKIDVGNSAYVKFRLRFLPKTYPYTITATITGVNGFNNILAGCDETKPVASATATVSLNCDASGGTIKNC